MHTFHESVSHPSRVTFLVGRVHCNVSKLTYTGTAQLPPNMLNPGAMSTQNMASMFGARLSSAYNQLRGDLGAPQTATDTIDKLIEKIQISPAVEDRRTAVLGLKGLSRDWKEVWSVCAGCVSC